MERLRREDAGGEELVETEILRELVQIKFLLLAIAASAMIIVVKMGR